MLVVETQTNTQEHKHSGSGQCISESRTGYREGSAGWGSEKSSHKGLGAEGGPYRDTGGAPLDVRAGKEGV